MKTKQELIKEAIKKLAEYVTYDEEVKVEVYDENEEEFSMGFEYRDAATIFLELNKGYGEGFVVGFEDLHFPSYEREHYDTIDEAVSYLEGIIEYINEKS